MNPRQIGIIGCGARINSLIKYMNWNPENLVIGAVCDRNLDTARQFAARLPDHPGIYETPEEMFNDQSIGTVMIMTPNATHAELVIAAFRAGKNVFSEKPMAVNFEECIAIHEAWRQSGRRYMIGFTLRHSPHYRKIREVVASGLIGFPVSLEFNENVLPEHGGHICSCWRRKREYTGFHLLEKCCHDLDIANEILASVPARVASFGGLSVFRAENAGLYDKYPDADGTSVFSRWPSAKNVNPFLTDKNIVDNQVCILEYESGVRGTFHTNINAPLNERRMYIAGSEGTLRADAISGAIEVRTIDGQKYDFATGEAGSHAGGDRMLMDALADMVSGKQGSDDMEIRSGITSAATAFALDMSMRESRIVSLAPWWQKMPKEFNLQEKP